MYEVVKRNSTGFLKQKELVKSGKLKETEKIKYKLITRINIKNLIRTHYVIIKRYNLLVGRI